MSLFEQLDLQSTIPLATSARSQMPTLALQRRRLRRAANHPDVTITLFTTRSEDEAQALYDRIKQDAPQHVSQMPPPVPESTLRYEYGNGLALYIHRAQVLRVVSELSEQLQADYDRIQAMGDDLEHQYAIVKAIAQTMIPWLGEHVSGIACGETPPDITPTVQVTAAPEITPTHSAARLDPTSAKGLVERGGLDYGGPWVDNGIVVGDEACVISRVHNNSEYPDTTMTLYTPTDDEAAASLFGDLMSTGQYVAIGPIHGGPTLPGNDYVYGHGVSLYLRGAQVLEVVTTLDAEEQARFDAETGQARILGSIGRTSSSPIHRASWSTSGGRSAACLVPDSAPVAIRFDVLYRDCLLSKRLLDNGLAPVLQN